MVDGGTANRGSTVPNSPNYFVGIFKQVKPSDFSPAAGGTHYFRSASELTAKILAAQNFNFPAQKCSFVCHDT